MGCPPVVIIQSSELTRPSRLVFPALSKVLSLSIPLCLSLSLSPSVTHTIEYNWVFVWKATRPLFVWQIRTHQFQHCCVVLSRRLAWGAPGGGGGRAGLLQPKGSTTVIHQSSGSTLSVAGRGVQAAGLQFMPDPQRLTADQHARMASLYSQAETESGCCHRQLIQQNTAPPAVLHSNTACVQCWSPCCTRLPRSVCLAAGQTSA